MGFDYFYGFVGGNTSQQQPGLFCNQSSREIAAEFAKAGNVTGPES